MTTKVKNTLKSMKQKYIRMRCTMNQDDGVVWISLGENCLSDDILKRFYLKSYSSLYASGRSNIDYNIAMHRQGYRGLFDDANATYGYVDQEKVLRNISYTLDDDIYHELHTQGFEFTHHDWLAHPESKAALMRRVKRMNEEIGQKHYVFLYHHRYTQKSNLDLLTRKLATFKQFFEQGGKRCFIILFYQEQVADARQRQLTLVNNHDGVLQFRLHTLHQWAGMDQAIFWARVDNDLIKKMLKQSRQIIRQATALPPHRRQTSDATEY